MLVDDRESQVGLMGIGELGSGFARSESSRGHSMEEHAKRVGRHGEGVSCERIAVRRSVKKASAVMGSKRRASFVATIGSSSAALATFQKDEAERWGRVIKAANIKLD